MSDGAYAFPGLPLSPVRVGQVVLVEGAILEGVSAFLLRATDPPDGEGAIIISTNTGGRRVFDRRRDAGCDPGADERVCVVDCVSRQQGTEVDERNVQSVSNPADLTGIGMRTSEFYRLFGDEGIDRVRVGLLSASTLLMYADLRRVSRFIHVLMGRVASADGLGMIAIDRTAHEDQAVSTIQQLCDGRIEVRKGGDGGELRVSGLPDQPDGWIPID